MARAGELVADTIALLGEQLQPGITTGELDRIAEEFIREHGGVPTSKGYRGFPAATCISPNAMVVHGIPGGYKLGQPYTINGHTYYPSDNPSYRSEGIASWYGPDFHGRLTANGEIFDMHGISAAHPTMPIPSYARVTNLDNGRSLIVRVNDRGPYARNRIIDVSIGAANALGFYGDGLAHVRVEYVGRAPIEGSDDRALLATLRDGRPAPGGPVWHVTKSLFFSPSPLKTGPSQRTDHPHS